MILYSYMVYGPSFNEPVLKITASYCYLLTSVFFIVFFSPWPMEYNLSTCSKAGLSPFMLLQANKTFLF